jgi:hypothetical protein
VKWATKAWRELLQAHDATVRRMKSREFIGGLGSVAAALNTRAALTNVIPEIIMIRRGDGRPPLRPASQPTTRLQCHARTCEAASAPLSLRGCEGGTDMTLSTLGSFFTPLVQRWLVNTMPPRDPNDDDEEDEEDDNDDEQDDGPAVIREPDNDE